MRSLFPLLALLGALGCPKAPAPAAAAAAAGSTDPFAFESDAMLSARCEQELDPVACRALGLRFHGGLLAACAQGAAGACTLLTANAGPAGGASRPPEALVAYDKACKGGLAAACEGAARQRAPAVPRNPACANLQATVWFGPKGVDLRGFEPILGPDKGVEVACGGGCQRVDQVDWAGLLAKVSPVDQACPDLPAIGLGAEAGTPIELVVEASARLRGTAAAPIFAAIELRSAP